MTIILVLIIATLIIALILQSNRHGEAMREANRIYIVDREDARRAGYAVGYKYGHSVGYKEGVKAEIQEKLFSLQTEKDKD